MSFFISFERESISRLSVGLFWSTVRELMTDGVFARHRHYRTHTRSSIQGVVRHQWASLEHRLQYQIHPAWSFDRDGVQNLQRRSIGV